MKNIKSFFLLIVLLNIVSFSQTQEKIPWPSLADSPWPVARGDVQATGRSEFIGPKNPEILWRKTYPLGIYNGPIIGNNGILFFGTIAGNFTASNENYFYCTDSEGELIWRFTTTNWVANDCAPVAASDGTVYFGTQGPNPAYFYALDSTGDIKWSYISESPFNIRNMVVDKEGNIFTATLDSLISFTPNGEIRFKSAISKITGKGLSLSPSGDTLYAISVYYKDPEYIYKVHSINSKSGEVFWEVEFHFIENGQTLLVDNSNKIYFQAVPFSNPQRWRPYIYSLNPDGSINWISPDEVYANNGPTIDKHGNIAFFASIFDNDEIVSTITSLDYHGNLRWIYEFEKEERFVEGRIFIENILVSDDEGTIYAAADFGYYLYAISKEGELLWQIPLDDKLYASSSPVITSEGNIIIGMHHGFWNDNVKNNLIAIGDNPNSVKEDELPSEYKLEQNYPNPFNPSTTIKFSLPVRSEVKLSIFNLLGQEIETLFQGEKEAGSYEYVFENKSLSTGVYFYVLESQQSRLSRKMMLIK